MEIRIDKGADRPLYLQVAAALREAILSGDLPDGERLPSTRDLAGRLGVHRNTVVEAYRTLERNGLVRAGVGAGTFAIAPRQGDSSSPGLRSSARGPFSWARLLRNSAALEDDPTRWLSPRGLQLPRDRIQLTGAIADSRFYPIADFSRCMRAVLADGDPQMLDYGPPEGYEPLREWVVEWLRRAGVLELATDRVFIVSGSQQGLDLLAKLLLEPGDPVALEAPTYSAAIVALRQAGARLLTVPIDDQGLVVPRLSERLSQETPKFIYTMPGYQNPTGVSLSAERRAALLQLIRREGLAIVEDHYDSDLHYWGEPPRPLLADDTDGQVIHLGTFSKMLFPGLRLGWMVVPADLVEPLRRLRWAADLASGMLTQRAMDRFCRQGHVEKHLRKVRRINGRRLKAMLGALETQFPAQARWTRPSGGMTLWCELPRALDTVELFHASAQRGVLFSPGVAFFPDGGGQNAMRLSFNRESEARIRRGIALLGEMIAERLRAHPPGRADHSDSEPFL